MLPRHGTRGIHRQKKDLFLVYHRKRVGLES